MTLVAITGVSRGIGKALALAFAARGADLALIGRPSEAHDATCQQCAALGVKVIDIPCDMGDAAQVDRAAKQVLERGVPDVVINNAAILERGARVHEIELERWDRIVAVNLRGPFLLSRALLPAMLERGSGRLLHIASVSGTIGCPRMAHYGASKWGLIGLSKAMSEELRGTGLQCIAILPGSVDTAMLEKTPFEPDMTAQDVAEVVLYYALDAPDAVHGASVEVYA